MLDATTQSKKKTPPTSSPSRFQELIPDRLRLAIGCLVATVAGRTARTATPARFGVGSTRRGIGFLEIDATACRRSLGITAPTPKKLRRRVGTGGKESLRCVLDVLGVLGCPGFQLLESWTQGHVDHPESRWRLIGSPWPPGQPTGPNSQGRTEGRGAALQTPATAVTKLRRTLRRLVVLQLQTV